jgi:hypothetical protein
MKPLNEISRLRAIFPKILEELQSGACTEDCSIEFLELIPREVRMVMGKLECELAEIRERAEYEFDLRKKFERKLAEEQSQRAKAIEKYQAAVKEMHEVGMQRDELRDASTYENAGCTASAMGWAIKYSNIQELVLRLIHAKGRFHTQRAFQDLREFILE